MIAGVEKPFVKKLILEGVGYRAELKAKRTSSSRSASPTPGSSSRIPRTLHQQSSKKK